ncbi:hypothetical protein B0J14DRAFT_595402 [Halenospora varia]|nr:hypothetical protein B0J14DRAFT_595402 [Halenospora varia]
MSSSMLPPALPSYSLRVQLFAPNAHITGDKPIRCFRVVTTPEVTIREFCEEASRIHEINYGKPLAIKKCQDDQEFDVTQDEVIGNLFPNTAIIRIVHANAVAASLRDESVPPTSALRFNPSNTKKLKRSREGSTARNSSGPPSARNSNKRQRLELDPDHPLPSREIESIFGAPLPDIPEINVVPNSQESIILGEEYLNNSRHVRPDFQIPETPSPPTSLRNDYYERYSTNAQHQKSAIPESSQANSETNISSPLKVAAARSESKTANPARAKSTSYHIERATERGRSVSTPATTPLAGENQQVPARNGTPVGRESQAVNASPTSGSAKRKEKRLRSKNEDSIYDDFSSGEAEAVAILNRNKSNLRNRKGQNGGSPSMVSPNQPVNTPPNGTRRRSHDLTTTPGALPLTPKSKERHAKQQEQTQNSEAKKARKAAADAAEQRRREAEKLRAVEEARIAEEKREQREEQERLEVEEQQRAEDERAAKAAKFKKEREEKQRKEAEEKRKREEEKKLKLEQERIAREKAEAERLDQEKAQAEEAERVRKAEEERLQLSQATKEKARKGSELAKNKSMSPTPNTTERGRRSSSASARRPQSSTPFIPSGRKSALKNPMPSPQAVESSPAGPSQPPEFTGVGIEDAMPLPKEKNRRVSFAEEDKVETPIRSSTRILPPKFGTQKESTTAIPPPKKLSKAVPSGRVSNSPIPVPNVPRSTKVSNSPIPPPKVPNSTKERKPTPLKETNIPTPRRESSSAILPSKKETPIPPPAGKSLTPPQASSTQVKQAPKKAPTPEVVVSSDDGSEEDIPAVVSPERAAKNAARRKSSPSPVAKSIAQPELEEESEEEEGEEDEDAEMASTRSSERDSRSPPVFNKHREQEIAKPKKSKAAEPESESSSDDDADDESEDPAHKNDASDNPQERQVEVEEDEEEEEGSSEEDSDIEMEESTPPELPAHKGKGKEKVLEPASSSQLNGLNSKDHTTDESQDTQEEINQQLTSSIYEARSTLKSTSPIPNPSSAAPRPAFKVGASLRGLNEKKQTISRINGAKTQGVGKLVLREASESGSEEESESESESESSSSEDLPNAKPPTSSARPTSAQKPSKPNSDSSSDSSSSGSDSESESEDEATRARKALAAQVANFSSQAPANGTQSQKTVNKTKSTKQKTYGKSPSGKKIGKNGFAFKLPGV